MSAPDPHGATQTDLLAADWLQRQNFWAWSEADQAALDAWLAESRAHRIAYWRQKSVWNNAQRLVALRPSPAAASAPKSPRPLLLRIMPVPLRIAATVAIVAAQFLAPVEGDRTFSTPLGGRETISFADGSKIELNTNTILRARMTTDRRIVWLDRGEAYFQVRHDPSHPFIVIAGNRHITDLGTKFLVRQDVSGLEVALLEGKIRFGSSDAEHSAILAPGDVALVSGNAETITARPMQSLTDELSWRHGTLVFKYRTLADVASEFNRYNSKKIIIADAAVGNLMIFGTFRTQDVDRFTRVTQKALGLNVKDEGDQILISR